MTDRSHLPISLLVTFRSSTAEWAGLFSLSIALLWPKRTRYQSSGPADRQRNQVINQAYRVIKFPSVHHVFELIAFQQDIAAYVPQSVIKERKNQR